MSGATTTAEVFRLPDVGEGLTEAEIVGWRVSAGQLVAVNDVLVEIETAKSLVELPSPVDGVVGELLVAEGDTVEVGSPIIRFGSVEDAPGATDGAGAGAAVPSGPAAVPGTAPAEGSPDQPVEPVPDRAMQPVPDQAGGGAHGVPDDGAATRSPNLVGYGAHQGAAAGRRRRLSTVPGRNGSGPGSLPADSADSADSDGADSAAASAAGGADGVDRAGGRRPGSAPLAKPPVRRLARELDVDLAGVRPTGPGGTVTRGDVTAAAQHRPPVPDPGRTDPRRAGSRRTDPRPTAPGRFRDDDIRPGRDELADRLAEPAEPTVVADDPGETRIVVRSVRRMTAEAMTASAFSAPHVTEFLDVDVTRSYRLLDRLRARKDFAGLKVSVVLLVAKAMCLAAQRTPEVNASWDGPNREIVLKHAVNLGIAAATPRGLLVPNVKSAQAMPLPELCREINALVATAREGRTTPDQMTGGTITLTNVGVFGVDTGTPILNPGESAILAVGAVGDRPWVHKGKVRPRKVMTLALSFDHRIVDGEQGSRFLADVGVILSDPATSLLWT